MTRLKGFIREFKMARQVSAKQAGPLRSGSHAAPLTHLTTSDIFDVFDGLFRQTGSDCRQRQHCLERSRLVIQSIKKARNYINSVDT